MKTWNIDTLAIRQFSCQKLDFHCKPWVSLPLANILADEITYFNLPYAFSLSSKANRANTVALKSSIRRTKIIESVKYVIL